MRAATRDDAGKAPSTTEHLGAGLSGKGARFVEERGRALLGLAVWADDVRLGTVSAVWIDPRNVVLGMEVESAWAERTHYVPWAAAMVEDGAVRTSALAVLGTAPDAFFAERGARRVSTRETLGFKPVRTG